MTPPSPPLTGYTVGVTAERRRAELGTALERQGARVRYGTALRVVPLADDTQLHEATTRALDGPLDYVVATTGVGFSGWLEAATGWGLRERFLAACAGATLLARGPKVRGAVRAAGLQESWSPESESTAEVQDHLLTQPSLAGARVAVQLHGDPLDELRAALAAAGAEVVAVPVYRWEPPADERPLHDLLAAVAAADIDAVTFTSAPAATNFLRTAAARAVDVHAALHGPVLCAAVGPVTAAPLRDAGIPVVAPGRHRLGALVRTVTDELPRHHPPRPAG